MPAWISTPHHPLGELLCSVEGHSHAGTQCRPPHCPPAQPPGLCGSSLVCLPPDQPFVLSLSPLPPGPFLDHTQRRYVWYATGSLAWHMQLVGWCYHSQESLAEGLESVELMNALFPFNPSINQSHITFYLLLRFAEKVVHLRRLTSTQIHALELSAAGNYFWPSRTASSHRSHRRYYKTTTLLKVPLECPYLGTQCLTLHLTKSP